jgi:hypothetical protein
VRSRPAVLRQGILWLVIAWVVLRGNQTSIAAVGILLILLAFWVSGSDQVYALAQRTFLILFWVGLVALFRGFTQIMLASVSATPATRPPPRSATRADGRPRRRGQPWVRRPNRNAPRRWWSRQGS